MIMPKTKMHEIAALGQSLWIDNISRSMISSGRLESLIDQGLRGQTSNPTIFKQAIASSADYDSRIMELAEAGKSFFEIYDDLTIKDVQDAADLFKGVYVQTQGLDGYVSLEINPKLGRESETQFTEGLRLWKKLARPNGMIKVPATKNGCLVVEQLIAEGVNVNATLIFSAEQYQQVAWSYIKGLSRFAQKGGDVGKVRSVASIFVSRIDAAVDKWLGEEKASLKGRAAVHNCAIIFHKFGQTFAGADFKALQAKGAHVQRVLWASTGTKDPSYSDIKYVTELITSPTVNTLPEKTLEAFLDHGTLKSGTVFKDVAASQRSLEELRAFGMDVNVLCLKLLEEGLLAFERSFEELMACIEEKTKKLCARGF